MASPVHRRTARALTIRLDNSVVATRLALRARRASTSLAGQFFDLATLTLGHPEHLDDVLRGYGADVDRGLIRAWWAWRCLVGIRWLSEHGYGATDEFPEVAVLRSLR